MCKSNLKDLPVGKDFGEHLMSGDKLTEFTQKMWLQLDKHRDDKVGIKNWELVEVWKLCMFELSNRLDVIRTRDTHVIEKQCIHMANYLFFLWQKCQEVNHPIADGDKR